jgi:hypothetical protein
MRAIDTTWRQVMSVVLLAVLASCSEDKAVESFAVRLSPLQLEGAEAAWALCWWRPH